MPTRTQTQVFGASQQASPAPLTEAAVRELLAGARHPEEAEIALAMIAALPDVERVEMQDGTPVLHFSDHETTFRRVAGTDAKIVRGLMRLRAQQMAQQEAKAAPVIDGVAQQAAA